MKKIWDKIKVYLRPFLSWKFAVCFGLGWMITNGWAWIGLGCGAIFGPSWFSNIAAAYMAFLWIPCTPEKIITIPIALWFHHLFFKNDLKTKEQLENMYAAAKSDWQATKNWFKRKFRRGNTIKDENNIIDN